jgi:hypothetical protein
VVSTHEPDGDALVSAEGAADSEVLTADDDGAEVVVEGPGAGVLVQAARAPAAAKARNSPAREDIEVTRPTLRGRSAGLQVGSTMVG